MAMALSFEGIRLATARARAGGALFSIETDPLTILEDGLEFVVRKATQLKQKEKNAPVHKPTFVNPFLPYDPLMYVDDISETHVCLLNKFNVVDYHILACTKVFSHQCERLNQHDFQAWWACLTAFGLEAVGFYNCGPASGASQPHKHMQIIPGSAPLLDTISHGLPANINTIHRSPLLPFRHAFIKLPDGHVDPASLVQAYSALAHKLHIPLTEQFTLAQEGDPRAYPQPFVSHNILLTRHMIFMTPRSSERASSGTGATDLSLALNALGFAGHILTKTDEERAWVQQAGALEVLRQITYPLGELALAEDAPVNEH